MAKFILAFLVLILQETATFTSLIFATYHGIYPAFIIHIFFVTATSIDIVGGYYVGKFLKRQFPNSRFSLLVEKYANKFSLRDKKYRRWIALFLLGNFSFPWINSSIAGYLEFPFWESAFFNFLGDILWYASIWLIAIGAAKLFKNFYYGLIAAVVSALVVIVIIKFLKSRKHE